MLTEKFSLVCQSLIADCASVKLPLRKLEQWNCYEITKLYEIAFNQDLLYLYRSFLRTCEKYCIVLAGLDVFCIVHLQIIWSVGFTVTASFEPLLIIGIWPVLVVLWFIGTNSGNSLFFPISFLRMLFLVSWIFYEFAVTILWCCGVLVLRLSLHIYIQCSLVSDLASRLLGFKI